MKSNLLTRTAAGLGAAVSAFRKGTAIKSAFSQAFIAGRDVDERLHGSPARFTEPYRQSAWVYSAVNYFADELSGRPLKFFSSTAAYDDAALAEFWARPCLGPKTLAGTQPRLSQAEMSRDLAAWAKLEGEWFLVRGDDWLITLRPDPRKLSPLLIAHPKRMRLILQGGVIMGYEYIDPAGQRSVFVPEQVTHWKAFNPYDAWRGLGAMQAAQVAAEGAFLTGNYIRELMRNNGDQGYIVIGKGGPATDAQRDQIVAALREKRAALRRGVAKDIFLGGDMTVDRPTEQAAGGDLIAGKALSHQEVYVAFGVPPSFAEVKASYSIGKDSDYFQFIIRGVAPLGMSSAGAISAIASFQAGRPITAAYYWDDHPVMVEVRLARVDIGLKLWATGWSWQAINQFLSLGMKGFTGWDERYLPFSVALADSFSSEPTPAPADDPALAEPKAITDPDLLALQLLVLARSRANRPECKNVTGTGGYEFSSFACRAHGSPAVGSAEEGRAQDSKKVKLWESYMRQRRATVKGFSSAFGRVLMAARVETLKKIETYAKSGLSTLSPQPSTPVLRTGTAAHLLFNLEKFANAFDLAMAGQQRTGLDTAGKQFFAEAGRDDPFVYPPAEVLDYLAARKNKLKDVPQSVYDRVKASLEEGITAGDTQADLDKRVKSIFNEIGDAEAKRISLTETAAVYGAGRSKAMNVAGVPRKAWLTSGNANVRAAHQQAGDDYSPENAIPIDEAFIVDGEELDYPGDDAGSAGNVINCHCVQIAVAAKEDES